VNVVEVVVPLAVTLPGKGGVCEERCSSEVDLARPEEEGDDNDEEIEQAPTVEMPCVKDVEGC
jgi:hypothetical protein